MGLYVVGMAVMLVIIIGIIFSCFEILSVLSIVFSAVSLNKSKKYVSFGGRYDYRSVKRFHTTAVVFFVFGCIGLAFSAVTIISVMHSIAVDSSYYLYKYSDTLFELLPYLVFTVGKYAAVLIVGIKSFQRFSEARVLWDSLCKNAAMTQNLRQNGYYGSNIPNQGYNGNLSYPYGQSHASVVPPPVYVRDENYQHFSERESGGLSFSTESKGEEKRVDTAQGKGVYSDEIPEKICPKCGEANSGLYKFCTLCGERLE